jgi:hypothetical protein
MVFMVDPEKHSTKAQNKPKKQQNPAKKGRDVAAPSSFLPIMLNKLS